MRQQRPTTGKIELHNWRDFTKIMKILGEGLWVYRGQEDADWHLDSGLDRQMKSLVSKGLSKSTITLNLPRAEFFAIARFREMAKKFQQFDSDAAALIAMQHYGAQTRLLDFTISIMVALFFAYENRANGKKRSIYAVNYRSLLNQNGVWNGYQTYLKSITAPEQAIRPIDRESEMVWWNLESQIENHYFQQYTVDDASANIWACTSDRTKGIIPLYKAAYNGRQTAQAGVELMPRTFDGFVENLAAALRSTESEINNPTQLITSDVSHEENLSSKLPSALVKIVFDPEMEDEAWLILDQANINAATIYPDIMGVARSVRYSERILGRLKTDTAHIDRLRHLEKTVRQVFAVWNGQDVGKFLEEMRVEGVDFERLKALRIAWCAANRKSASGESVQIASSETDMQFIEDVEASIRRLATIANVWIPFGKVFSCSLDETIRHVVSVMVKNSYSHVPVLDVNKNVIGVFSEATMLEMNKIGIGNDGATTMRDISKLLPFDKHTADVFRFVPRNDPLVHVRRLCDDALKKRERIGMFFVTENGKADEPLLGVFTVWDVAGAPNMDVISQ